MIVKITKAFGIESKPSQFKNDDGTPKEWVSNNFLADYNGTSIRVNTNFKDDIVSLVGRKVELINCLQDKTLPSGVVQYKMTYKDKATLKVLEDSTIPAPATTVINPQPEPNKSNNLLALVKELLELKARMKAIEDILESSLRK